jgi:hypothetical protein
VTHRGRRVLAATIALVAGAAATTTTGAAAPGESASGCEMPVGHPDEDDLDGALVVLVDGTVSVATQEGRAEELVDLLDRATVERQLAVSVGGFGGSDAEVRFSRCLDGVAFVPQGNNDRTRERNRPALIEAATEQMADLPGGFDTSDPTAALRAGIDRLADTEGARLLVIHTDGIPTAGCAALPEQVDVSDPTLIERLTAACSDAGQLPAADADVEIVIGGVGRTNQDLSAESVTFLIELNTALCGATGATCHVDPNLPPEI